MDNLKTIIKVLDSANKIVVAGGLSFPEGLLAKISPIESTCDVFDMSVPGLGLNCGGFFGRNATVHNTFNLPNSGDSANKFYLSNHFHRIENLPCSDKFDVCLLRVTRLDNHNYSTGLNSDFLKAIVDRSKHVIVEVNSSLPQMKASSYLLPKELVLTEYESDASIPEYTPRPLNDTSKIIAKNIANLIQDGDCLQLGFGSIPDALYNALTDHKNLGLHTGMLASPSQEIISKGVFNNKYKPIDKGASVTGYAAGDKQFYDWLSKRSDIVFRPVSYTHNPSILKQIPNFTAINTTVDIDLFGQANSEFIKGKQLFGSGGLNDFIRGSQLAPNGRSIIALNSTSNKGKVSRIVPLLNSPASILRNDMDILVTEYGVAHLKGKTVEQRAESIISLAHPNFRQQLIEDWNKGLKY